LVSHLSSSSERIVIVGGGFAGLSAAVRLAQAGLPVTVLEASKLGFAASTRNQGWLHSGAWFARTHPELARMCHESLQQTIDFCPDCIEQGFGSMIYLGRDDDTDQDVWTKAWDQVGIPYEPIQADQTGGIFPQLNRQQVRWQLRLPDRAFRPDVLLSQLATTARNAGAEIRSESFVTGLLMEDRRVHGVAVGAHEDIRASLVILATGASSAEEFSQLFQPQAGRQSECQLVALKTHLRAIRPGLGCDPFCIVDGIGLNHLPHPGTSVFGSSRWKVVANPLDNEVAPGEIEIIQEQLEELFPDGLGEGLETTDWAGTTVQAMQVDQIQPGDAPLPTIVDHAREPCGIENVLSIFPGRATLWAQLAERVRVTVLDKVGSCETPMAQPPWAVRP
jgi:glycine/D-amino acid oxidase-like deaminating enzyme